MCMWRDSLIHRTDVFYKKKKNTHTQISVSSGGYDPVLEISNCPLAPHGLNLLGAS